MTRAKVLTVLVAAVLVVGSAVGVAFAKYETRKLFVELEGLRDGRDALETEWGQLQLEQSTLAAHGRVERLASDRLSMRQPRPEEVVVISP
ncbi:MAG: cell division protein FtsL [Chromatiales bacterium]|jgi:cell division protein FtsL